MKNHLAVIALIAVVGSDAIAEIYKFKNARGEWEYSSTPPTTVKAAPTGIQNEYSTAPKFRPKPVPKGPEFQGPTVITIGGSSSGAPSKGCTTGGNGSLAHSGVMDAWQDQQWKKCHRMR
jgi:hypothetical protein